MYKKIILTATALLSFCNTGHLYAAEDKNIKVAASFSKFFVIGDILYPIRFEEENFFGASVMFANSNNTDVGLEVKYSPGNQRKIKYSSENQDVSLLACSASFRYLFNYQDSIFRPYVRFSAGLYKELSTHTSAIRHC
ncbi:hypothetical protein Cyrtocomes_00421 [Candidatus Cyrtobacter comes]|uniref:Outer membrane protein beta-barrel domain-containing protein n=1 Tax=Candidatus Cyrtobacter comes TaxID=675776 RepID=A0ABU5L850_9RICK|nr:hypothetical protein [Candidatus Cyrtobacter comes]MDZ5762055.1 hypothetical protein [Candidatus Cyrtobacter comes]